MFGLFSKKNRDEVEDLSRRSFLKGAATVIPAGVAGVVVMGASKSIGADTKEATSVKADYLKKTWVDDGITYMEYELPSHIQPFFKHPEGRGRAISVPIYNLDKEAFDFTEGDGRKMVFNSKERKEKFVNKLKKYIEMHQRQEPRDWADPYIYIINIRDNDKLFGAMINQKKLEFETNVYTVYG